MCGMRGRGSSGCWSRFIEFHPINAILLDELFIYGWLEGEEYRSVINDSLFLAKSCDKCRKTQLDIFHVSSVGDILRNVGPHVHVHTCHELINEIGPH